MANPTAYEAFITIGIKDNAVREYEDLAWIDEMIEKKCVQIEPAKEVELKGEEDDCGKSNEKSMQEVE